MPSACGQAGSMSFSFFNNTAPTEIYTLSLHDALPIYQNGGLFTQGTAGSGASASGAGRDQTGNFLGNAGQAAGANQPNMPVVVPNPFDNTLIIKGSSQEIEQIKDLLRQLDVAPRQILIDAKIYEVDLTGSFSAGVESALQATGT